MTLNDNLYEGRWIHISHLKDAIQNAERRLKEVISMEWDVGRKYVLSEVQDIFIGEFGEELCVKQEEG